MRFTMKMAGEKKILKANKPTVFFRMGVCFFFLCTQKRYLIFFERIKRRGKNNHFLENNKRIAIVIGYDERKSVCDQTVPTVYKTPYSYHTLFGRVRVQM